MKKVFLITILSLFLSISNYGQEVVSNHSKSDNLIGEWIIDLRPTPESEGYFQFFTVDSIDNNSFQGTFYGSELEKSLLNTNWDKLYFSFTSRDTSNEYYHSGYLLDGILYGITYCPNRKFTAPWTGRKK